MKDAMSKNVRATCLGDKNSSQVFTRGQQPRSSIARGLAMISLSLAIPFAAMNAQAAPGDKPLVEKVRASTGRYRDVNVAMNEGWVPATPCVSGPNEGAMGVHFVLPSRIDGVVNASEPEALIYEPLPSGELRLVGVEFIAIADAVGPNVPKLEGHLLNYVGAPNRYGLPAFYEMHVWAWQNNPKGSFADWNTTVSCDAQPLD